MSAQCWCFHCAGAIVTRKTFIAHGRKSEPDAPIAPENEAPLNLAPPLSVSSSSASEPREVHVRPEQSGPEEGDEDDEPLSLEDVLNDHGIRFNGEMGGGKISEADLVVLILDWMHANKGTATSAEYLWSVCKLLAPEEATVPSFWTIKRILQSVEGGYCQRIDCCPNDCILIKPFSGKKT